MQTTRSLGRDHSSPRGAAWRRRSCAAGWLAAKAAACRPGPCRRGFPGPTLRARRRRRRRVPRRHFTRLTGRLISNGRRQRGGPASFGVHLGIKIVDRRMVRRPSFQRKPCCSCSRYSVLEPSALITARRGMRSIRPRCFSSENALPNGARIAQVPAGDDDPVGRLPIERLEHAVHDRLLPLEPQGIDAVAEVDVELVRRPRGRGPVRRQNRPGSAR